MVLVSLNFFLLVLSCQSISKVVSMKNPNLISLDMFIVILNLFSNKSANRTIECTSKPSIENVLVNHLLRLHFLLGH